MLSNDHIIFFLSKTGLFDSCSGQSVARPLNLLLLLLLEDPDLVPTVGELEGTVIPGCVERLVDVLDAVPLQALHKFQKLFSLHIVIGKTTECPGRTRGGSKIEFCISEI